MAYVPLLYSLGWPGMESLPCVVVDHVTRDVYTNTNKLPLNKLYLNTTANKYVELSAVLKLFPPEKDKDAMHNFMTISSEFGMRKFFMDRYQRAYISLDTLLVYMIVYPSCPEFQQARSEVARFLQSYRELPCCRCGFIKRDCRCNNHFFNGQSDCTYDIIGYATGQITQETQTEVTDLVNSASYTGSQIHDTKKDKERGQTGGQVDTKSSSTQTWIAPPSQKSSFGTGSASEKDKPSVKITPISVVAPMRTKTLMVDASCQTRANFDFNVKSRIKTMPSSKVKETESSGTSVFTINNEKSGNTGNGMMKESAAGLATALSSNHSNTFLVAPKQPVKISLWKLLDSDSSDDEFIHNDKQRDKPVNLPLVPLLPKSIDFSNEPKESNTTENLSEVECSLLQEAERLALSDSKQSDLDGNTRKGLDVSLCPKQIESDITPGLGQTESENRNLNPVIHQGREAVRTECEHIVRPQDDKVTSQKEGEGSANLEDSAKLAEDSALETNPLEDVQEKRVVLAPDEDTESLKKTIEGSAAEDMDTSFEVTAFEALSENAEATALSEKLVNDVMDVISDGAESMTSITQEPKSTNYEPVPSRETPERCLVIDERTAVTDKLHGSDDSTEAGVVELSSGNHKTRIPSTSETKSVFKGDTFGSENLDKMKEEDTVPTVPKSDIMETKHLLDEKPGMTYKKWCHKFEYTPTSEKLYRCTFLRCGQCFDTKKAAVVHNKVHGSFGHENPTHIVCFKCDYTANLNKWFDIVRHLKLKHNELITNHDFGCYLCGRDFDSSEKLNKHIDFHYSGRYKCVHCGSVLFTWKQVEEHVKESCESKDKKEKNLGCPYCPLVFHIRNMRNAHMLSHQDKGLVCAFCDSDDLWENWKQLRKHYQQKHPQKIRSSLNPHKKKDVPDTKPSRPALQSFKIDIKKNPVCNICEEEFDGDEDFFYHMSKKHDFVPYVLSVCEICEKTFRTQKMYDWHMRNTHSEDIKCERCSFVAKTQALLKNHMQTRHQDREHMCVECGKDFSHYRELRMHMARHALHTIYCCEICGEEFKRQRELRQHSATVHPKQNESLQQECLECDHRCYTRRAMEAHVRKYHPKLAEEIEECENDPPPQLNKPEKPLQEYSTPAAVPPTADTPVSPEKDIKKEPHKDPIVARPSRYGSKKSRKKLKKMQSTEPRMLTEKEEERRRLKRQRREKIEKLRLLVKVSSARTRTYEDFKDMLVLNLIEHPQEQTIDHEKIQIIHSEHDITEPVQKRLKVSKYGRSIVTKALDDIYVSGTTDSALEKYVEQPQHLHEKQRRAESQKRRRAASGLYGILQPATWAEEFLEYPYTDHSYFALENNIVVSNSPPQSLSYNTEGAVSAELTIDSPTSSLPGMQTYRIGPSGVVKKQHNRKQTIKYRTGVDTSPPGATTSLARSSEFMPLHRDVTHAEYSGADVEYGKDIQEEIINQELMREVSEIAQQDPVLQDLINSMQQNNGTNILSTQQMPSDVYGTQTDNLLDPGPSRVVTPPKSLNLHSSMQLFDPTTSPGNYQTNIGHLPTNTPTKNELNIGTGLTPTKQNVVDFLMSRLGCSELEDIDVNDEELKLLLNEHVKAEQVQPDGSQKPADRAPFSEAQVSLVQEELKKDNESTSVLNVNPELPTSVSDINEVEEFVTADGRVLRTSGGSVLGMDTQSASQMVNLDNPNITSITPLGASQPFSPEHSESPLCKGNISSATSQQSQYEVPTSNDVLHVPGGGQPVPGLHSVSPSSGIDALLEASELSNLTRPASKTTPYQDMTTECIISKTSEVPEEQIHFFNQEGQLMNKSDIDVSIEQEISTQADMLEQDGSDTDSSPDKDLTGALRQSPFEAEFENFVKGPNPAERSSSQGMSGPAVNSISRGTGPLLQPHMTSSLLSGTGKQHIVVRHMLQEPATVSVIPSASQRMVAKPSSAATTVKLIRGPSQRPTVVSYSKAQTSSYNQVIRQVPVPSVRPRFVPQFERGRTSLVVGGHPRPAHRVVRLASPVSQGQLISVPRVRPSHPTGAASALSTTQRQVEMARPGTKIIRIIQKPASKETSADKGLLTSGTGPSTSSQ